MATTHLDRADGLPETREQYRARLTAEARSLGTLLRDLRVRLTRQQPPAVRRVLERRRDALAGRREAIVQALAS